MDITLITKLCKFVRFVTAEHLDFTLERIVMTPKKKTATSTTLKMERKRINMNSTATPATGVTPSKSNGNLNGDNSPAVVTGSKVHIAGGKNSGIVVNKEIAADGK